MPGIGIIVLAAGGSTRMGTPKQLLPFGNGTLIDHIIEIATGSACRPIIVVLGARADEVRKHADAQGAIAVVNEDWKTGIASSIRTGITALKQHSGEAAQGCIIITCDQPFITSDLLDKMVETQAASGTSIVAAAYSGTVGVPALFEASVFSELLQLSGDKGAKGVIAKHSHDSSFIEFSEGKVDLDTKEEYRAVAKALKP